MITIKTVRKLSDIEATFAYTHAVTHGSTQATTHVTVNATFAPEELARAVGCWFRRFPLLSLRIGEVGDSLWFYRGPGPQPDQVGQSVLPASCSPAEQLAEEVDDVLPPGGWLWRLRVCHDPNAAATHLYLTCHQAIADGYATARLVRAFLDVLFEGTAGDGGVRRDVGSLAPNADELTYQAPAPPDAAHQPRVLRPAVSPAGDHRPGEGRGAAFLPLSLSQQESLRLRGWCRKHQITVNQFFAAALAESFAQAAGRQEIALVTTVSLRQRYAESVLLSDLGCFVNLVKAPLRLGDGTLVDHARSYAGSLRTADAAWRPARRPHPCIRRAVEGFAGAEAGAGVCITNVGAVDTALGPHASRVTGFRTVVNRKDATAVGALHLSTFKGAFEMSLAFGTPSADGRMVRATARGLRHRAAHPEASARGG